MSAAHDANVAELRKRALAGSEVALDCLLFCARLEEQAAQIARLQAALSAARPTPEAAPTQHAPGMPS